MIIQFFLRIYSVIPIPIAITIVKRYIRLMAMFFFATNIKIISIFLFVCMLPILLSYFFPSFSLYHIRWIYLWVFLLFLLLLVDNIRHHNNLLTMILIRYRLRRRIWLWFRLIWILPFTRTIMHLRYTFCDASGYVSLCVLCVCVHDVRYDDGFPFFVSKSKRFFCYFIW